MARAAARLWLLATPLALAAPFRRWSRRFDEMLWRYALWATQAAGPTCVKLAQWASSRDDRFPAIFCEKFSRLQDDAKRHRWVDTERALDLTLPGWRDVLDFEDRANPIGTGCVAQVYKATLARDVPDGGGGVGDVVAVKVVHPEARRRVHVDLLLLRAVANAVEFAFPAARWCSLVDAVEEFSNTLENQMDMRREADHLARFARNFKDVKDVSFPRPRRPLCSDDILVEDFVRGESMKDFVRRCSQDYSPTTEKNKDHHPGKDPFDLAEEDTPIDPSPPSMRVRARLAKIGVDAVCKMIFHDNLLHGDLHPGNVLVTDDGQKTGRPKVCFLDAGIVVELQPQQHAHFVDVLGAFMRHDGEKAGRLMLARQRSKGRSPDDDDNDENDQRAKQDDFCLTLKAITDNVADEPFFENVSSYTTRIFDSAARSRVRLEGYFVSTAIAIRVMEGVANALDKDVKIGKLAIPWILSSSAHRREIAPPSPPPQRHSS